MQFSVPSNRFKQVKAELNFLRALTAVNLSSAMEYRASFISQIVGMLLNDGIYFVFWLIFFNRFGAVRGYTINDIYLLFAVVTLAFGLANTFGANTGANLATLIAQGRLDYYLVFPRNLLLHVIFSRMSVSAVGDLTFGIIAYTLTGLFQPIQIALFFLTSLLAATVLMGFGVATGSLAFFMGNAQYTSQQMSNAVLTFGLYPNSLFSGFARFLLYTLLPSAFIGAVPVQIVKAQGGIWLLWLSVAAATMWGLGTAVFYLGLRRYESGSAININI